MRLVSLSISEELCSGLNFQPQPSPSASSKVRSASLAQSMKLTFYLRQFFSRPSFPSEQAPHSHRTRCFARRRGKVGALRLTSRPSDVAWASIHILSDVGTYQSPLAALILGDDHPDRRALGVTSLLYDLSDSGLTASVAFVVITLRKLKNLERLHIAGWEEDDSPGPSSFPLGLQEALHSLFAVNTTLVFTNIHLDVYYIDM